MSYKYCCYNFAAARQSGTDNEGYGRLVDDSDNSWFIGRDLPPIRHCPWCGVELKIPPQEQP